MKKILLPVAALAGLVAAVLVGTMRNDDTSPGTSTIAVTTPAPVPGRVTLYSDHASVAATGSLQLAITRDSASTFTVGWVPPPGIVGYVFNVDGARVSNTWNPAQSTARFAKKPSPPAHVYEVVPVINGVSGTVTYPPTPPPTTTTAPTTTTTAAPPLWRGDTASDFKGGWEFAGTSKSSPTLGQRVTYTPGGGPAAAAGTLHITVQPGDQYFSTSGWRTLGRPFDPGVRTLPAGYKSWWVWAEKLPPSYPGDANVWVSPLESHQTKPSYVSVTGPSPFNMTTSTNGVGLTLRGGRDGSYTTYVNQLYPGSFTAGVWNVYALYIDHEYSGGAVELWHCAQGGTPAQVMSRSGISTMYEGTTTYIEFGLYRAQTGTSTTSLDVAGLREYADRDAALGWELALCA